MAQHIAREMDRSQVIAAAGHTRPVLIAGPTASGKSALALDLAEARGGVVVNADALQVYDDWQVLTARPGPADLLRARHALYGHVPGDTPYSVGHWLRDVAPLLSAARPIIVGGTGLNLSALTEGLADIPPTPPELRARANARRLAEGAGGLLAELDPATAARIDRDNPMRIQRAWEVQRNTGRGLAAWQDDPAPPLLPASRALCIVVDPGREVLRGRIAARFEQMLEEGALDEARANLPMWDPDRPSSKAIGARDLIAYLAGEIPLETARERTILATRQYAKRQRHWFRRRMADWVRLAPDP